MKKLCNYSWRKKICNYKLNSLLVSTSQRICRFVVYYPSNVIETEYSKPFLRSSYA